MVAEVGIVAPIMGATTPLATSRTVATMIGTGKAMEAGILGDLRHRRVLLTVEIVNAPTRLADSLLEYRGVYLHQRYHETQTFGQSLRAYLNPYSPTHGLDIF